MKRFFILLSLVISSLCIFAQDDVITEMCGIEFGSDKETARRFLTAKFGSPSDDEFEYLGFENIFYAGVRFDIAFFSFQHDGNRSYLNDISLLIKCKTVAKAISEREKLKNKLEENYALSDDIDDKKFRYYQGGTSPTDPNQYGFLLCIYKDQVTKGGGFIVSLRYGRYDYVKESF